MAASPAVVGVTVWAKIKGSPPWPAKVIEPNPEVCKKPTKKGNYHFVKFFGTNDHAWIDDGSLWPYKDFRQRYGNRDRSSASFKTAVKEADDSLADQSVIDQTKIMQQEVVAQSDLPSIDDERNTLFPTSVLEDNREPFVRQQDVCVPTDKKLPKRKGSNIHSKEVASAKTRSVGLRPVTGKSNKCDSKNNTSAEHLLPGVLDGAGCSPRLSSPTIRNERNSRSPLVHLRSSGDVKSRVYDFSDGDLSPTKQIISNKSAIKPVKLSVGFLGLGIMGSGMVRSLIRHGHKVTVWNRNRVKCQELSETGLSISDSPADVVAKSDVTFSCVSEPFAVKDVVFGKNGVMHSMVKGKGFVEMSTVDVETICDCSEHITRAGGLYLEAPVSGNKSDATDGSLLILAAGSEELFKKCTSCFQAMGKRTYYLGDVGNGARLRLCVSLVMGTMTAALSEGMALADRVGIDPADVLDVLCNSDCYSTLLNQNGKVMLEGVFATQFPLKHQQKDLRLAIDMADLVDQSLPVAAAANELFKRAKGLGLGNHDTAAVLKACTKQ